MRRASLGLGMVIVFCSVGWGIEENEGWPVEWASGGTAPVVVDFEGDGDLEVVAGTFGPRELRAWDAYGLLLDGWPVPLRWRVEGALGATDIDNDGQIDVMVTTASGNSDTSFVHAIRRDGSEATGWPVLLMKGVYAAHTNFDLDADGQIETIQPLMIDLSQGELRILCSDGRDAPGSPMQIGRALWSSAAVGDVDLDGDMEFFFGAYQYPLDPIGWVYGYHHDGTPVIGSDGVFVEIGSAVVPPISLVDLAGDQRPEVIVADYLGRIQVWDASGQRVPGWPRANMGAIATIPVVMGSSEGKATALWTSTRAGQVYIRDAAGELLPGWPWTCSWDIKSQPLVADLDGDRAPEAFIGGCAPYNWALNHDGTVVEGWPVHTDANDFGTGYITDLDQDGDTDIVFQGYNSMIHVYDAQGVYDVDRVICPAYQYDNWHTGSYEKDLYREAESANALGGWVVRSDTTAWGHAYLARDESARPVEAGPDAAESGRLFFRTETPVWRRYTLWIRLRRTRGEAPWPRVTIDDRSLNGKGGTAPSPGEWIWYRVGRRPLVAGIHELRIAASPALEIDRWLLTTRESFPLLEERPHGW